MTKQNRFKSVLPAAMILSMGLSAGAAPIDANVNPFQMTEVSSHGLLVAGATDGAAPVQSMDVTKDAGHKCASDMCGGKACDKKSSGSDKNSEAKCGAGKCCKKKHWWSRKSSSDAAGKQCPMGAKNAEAQCGKGKKD